MKPEESAYLKLNEASPSIQTHLQIIQGVIQRMASNSASCKTWCVTIVAAILVLAGEKENPKLVCIALMPTILFGALDVYYLGLEKGFRKSYNDFIEKLHSERLVASDLYSMTPTGGRRLLESMTSFSIWGFYVTLILLAMLTVWLI